MSDVKFDETWPFRIRIVDGDRTVAVFERIVGYSKWKTLEDVRSARDWDGMSCATTVEDARELIAQQEREVRMFAASPDLYEALKDILEITDRKHVAWDKARAALAKAEGQS